MVAGQRVRRQVVAARSRVSPLMPRLAAWASWRPTPAEVQRRLPAVIGGVVVVGLVAIAVLTPISGRGDYGQWLMTSRFYLGQAIPDYRDVSALPPFVPLLLAVIRLVIPDPVAALQVLNAMLLAGLGASFYLLGATLLSGRWAGVFSVLIGFMVTDRFLELFAFGGLLQASAIMFMALCLVAFVRATRTPQLERRWWLAGTAALALAVLSHVATGLIALPVGLGAAGMAAFARRQLGWRVVGQALLPLLVALLAVAVYWAVVLLPASDNYVTNPASLAYRGPDRLFSSLFSYWPTSVVVAMGACAIALGSLGEVLQRRAGGHLVLLLWLAATWGLLGYSILSGAATDYPRFATVLLAPLVVAAAGAMVWLVGMLASYLRELLPKVPESIVPVVAILALIGISAPFAVERYARQASVYQPRDALALTAAASWIDNALGDEAGTVLTDVRDGKWLEGLTGREALFSLPVRYAFRPVEWQRSLDADALLRSTTTMTSGLVTAMVTNRRTADDGVVPSDLLLRVNHGGEFVDVLRLSTSEVMITAEKQRMTASQLSAVRTTQAVDPQQVTVSAVWAGQSRPRVTFLQRVTVWRDGAALRVLQESRGNGIATVLYPPAGMTWTITDTIQRETTVCLSMTGSQEPCVRIWAGQDDVTLKPTADGGLRIATAGGHRIELLVTALTAGEPSVDMALIDPATLIAERNVRAALLWTADPAFLERSRRLEALGFRAAMTSGSYQVMLLDPVHTARQSR